jgi:hypothetical protein
LKPPGIIASKLAVIWDHHDREKRLKAEFAKLEGEWDHLNKARNKIEGATTKIVYERDGKLRIASTTQYGKWNGRIVMDPAMPEYGGGMFQYEGKDESGLLQIIVKSPDLIYVAPATITHETQKTNFYIWHRRKQGDA